MLALGATIEVRSARGSRTIGALELITGALTTSLEPGELIVTIRIPRLDGQARGAYHKISFKLGDFAESYAIIVVDPAHSAVRAVLAGHRQPPLLMTSTAAVLSSSERKHPGAAAIKQAVREDLRASELSQTLSSHEIALHQASMGRAARQIWSA
jgi:carbon-monoxide dehydrogenase medium subunit